MSGLRVHIAEKRYASPPALVHQDMRFECAPGTILGIVGPSGAGKTTLLNMVGGIDTTFRGDVSFGEDGSVAARPVTGYVFQSPRLMPWLTVLENVTLVVPEDPGTESRARDLLREVGLAEYCQAYPGQLSGGMQRRVGLARAFAVSPSLLLMDEPFVSLDAPTVVRLQALTMKLWEAFRPTVLYVTHDLREALGVADRVLFLSGRPSRVILDLPVAVERPRVASDPRVGALADQILAAHPGLLSGAASFAEAPAASAADGTRDYEQPQKGRIAS